MKITVDLPESDLSEICRATGIAKRGPAIRKLVSEALMLRRRAELAGKFMSGEWSAELAGVAAAKTRDRAESQHLADLWRD